MGNGQVKTNPLKRITQYDQFGLIMALVGICIIFGILSSVFFTPLNWSNILRQSSYSFIAAIGMTMIILSGEIDISVGSTQALAGVLAVMAMNATGSVWVGLIVCLAVGLGTGLANGLLVSKLGLNSFITTLATMAIFRGIIKVATNAVSQPVQVEGFAEIGTGNIGAIPIPVIIAIAFIIVFYFIINKSVFGRYIYAVGGNKEAAELAGLNVNKIKLSIYIIGNLLFAVCAFILTARLNSGQSIAGEGLEMNIIAAVILGGVSMTGGSGSLVGALIGVLLLQVIQNGLVLLDVNSFWQEIVRGLVIIIAVYIDVRRKKSAEAKALKESQAAWS